jgi:hypothetical protein
LRHNIAYGLEFGAGEEDAIAAVKSASTVVNAIKKIIAL